MAQPLSRKFTLADLRSARQSGAKIPFLTCYDFTMARLMHEVGVPAILVGDSAANVVLGHPTTIAAPLDFMIEITAAVRRGAPLAFLLADMPFGSYQASTSQGVKNVSRMLKLTDADCIKLEVSRGHLSLVRRLADAGVAVMAHIGLKPQSVGLLGGYKFQGRTAREADQILDLAVKMEDAGAAALLLEAVPPEVGAAVVNATSVPVVGCGAGPACHGSIIVTHDAFSLTPQRPRFVPDIADLATETKDALSKYVDQVATGKYPAAEHQYVMPAGEKEKFLRGRTHAQS